ncbi:type II/IV secretion system protein [bacterium]|jgi:type IV pilus assembly protein PilB|nr:type II/IV secretion system protein [bacterium]MBT4552018.1 type II/IV secretion system protein [bacterium]MBT7088293.1 type II/IV secretion system protein [bacterium]
MAKEFNLIDLEINPQIAHMLSEEVVKKYRVLPLKLENNILEVAMVNPDNLEAIDEIKLLTGCEIKPVSVADNQLQATIEKHFRIEETAKQDLIDMRLAGLKAVQQKGQKIIENLERAEDQPIIKLLNSIINGAISAKASDVHLEPQEPEMRVRYRVDGILHDIMTIPRHIEQALVSRTKIISEMDISEKRQPQDGHASIHFQGETYDLRVASMPTVSGEKMVLRILDKNNMLLGLEKLGLGKDDEENIKSLITKPYGMIFVTGPTGSGKTTALYSILSQLNAQTNNIVTIEDPVEFKLNGINQTQINAKAGVTFANGLRAILRQDPNIIMVGEVRDLETAQIAIQAALTGHLVLSTLHTNDAPSAVTRLLDMGIEPFLISSTVIGSVAIRLARKLCTECHGKGCTYCYHIGLKGRTGIFEVMSVTDEIKKLILERASSTAIKDLAITQGFKTLQVNGQEKIKQGVCSPDEVKRVVYS